jgi:hypothetical protein
MKTKSLFFVSMLTVLAPVQPMVLMAIFTIILDMAFRHLAKCKEKRMGINTLP